MCLPLVNNRHSDLPTDSRVVAKARISRLDSCLNSRTEIRSSGRHWRPCNPRNWRTPSSISRSAPSIWHAQDSVICRAFRTDCPPITEVDLAQIFNLSRMAYSFDRGVIWLTILIDGVSNNQSQMKVMNSLPSAFIQRRSVNWLHKTNTSLQILRCNIWVVTVEGGPHGGHQNFQPMMVVFHFCSSSSIKWWRHTFNWYRKLSR